MCVSPCGYFVATMSVSRTVSEIFSIKEWRDPVMSCLEELPRLHSLEAQFSLCYELMKCHCASIASCIGLASWSSFVS